MAKKRKNTQKKSTTSKTTEQNDREVSTSSSSSNTNRNNRKRRFDSFPLHLVPDDGVGCAGYGKDKSRELHELCKGRVWVIPSFFSPKECRAWIDFCESFSSSSSGNDSGFQYTAHPATKYVANRECYRIQQDNATELSERIFKRLQGMTTTTTNNCDDEGNGNGNGIPILAQIQQETADLYPPIRSGNKNYDYKPINCNPNIRVYKYDEGHAFGRHVDGSNLVTGRGSGTTEMTMLIYLSTCEGGATRFHHPSGRRSRKQQQGSSSSFAFEPQVGALLLHVHGKFCLEHEADEVLSGKKYVLRTDLVYGNDIL